MKLFVSYLKMRIKGIILFAVFSAVFMITFYLYALPVEAVIYASALCGALGAICIIISFYSYRKKQLLLQELENRITLDITGLPEPKDAIEKHYIQLITFLFDEKSKIALASDAAHSELSDYYTMWAHQIKVPLAALKLLIQSGESRSDKLISELFKIEQYVEMVLGYLRMESMSSDLLLKRYPLDDIVKQAVRKYATLFIHKKIRLELAEPGCQVLTDEKWLVFVVEQILSNSLKYTQDGGCISIRMDKSLPKTLVIEDTGIGISDEDVNRVFRRGFTGYNGRADKKATGIGLYMCKRILNKLSHTITIQSEVGKGTTVKIGLDNVDTLQ